MDLKYIQTFRLADRLTFQIDADLFNVFDNQTGYNFQSAAQRVGLRDTAVVLRSTAVPAGGEVPILSHGQHG
jgi:hypothetical protein